MKIVEMNLKKGLVKLIPEHTDDLWHLYNIIYKDDEVYAFTTRELKSDEQYSRKKRGERIPVFLGIKVEKVFWDRLVGRLRVHGVICQAPDIVPTGAHHTINISLNTPITIVKNQWTKHHLERLKMAQKSSGRPTIIMSIDDEGYAIALITHYGLDLKVDEHVKLPSKFEADKRNEAVKAFFKKAADNLHQVWSESNGPVAIIGVGFLKNDFAEYLKNEKPELAKAIIDIKSVNNSGVAGIYEALRSGVLTKTIQQLRVMEETEVMEEVLKRLGKGEGNVVYGLDDVKKAAELSAIEVLLIADTMLRESSDEHRLLIEEIMRNVEDRGGRTIIISTGHEAGEKLLALGGMAALLRFSLPH
ncbi:MAG: mRNA surveillance protein pelota [Candidatus Bathyarchaeia archaeon]